MVYPAMDHGSMTNQCIRKYAVEPWAIHDIQVLRISIIKLFINLAGTYNEDLLQVPGVFHQTPRQLAELTKQRRTIKVSWKKHAGLSSLAASCNVSVHGLSVLLKTSPREGSNSGQVAKSASICIEAYRTSVKGCALTYLLEGRFHTTQHRISVRMNPRFAGRRCCSCIICFNNLIAEVK